MYWPKGWCISAVVAGLFTLACAGETPSSPSAGIQSRTPQQSREGASQNALPLPPAVDRGPIPPSPPPPVISGSCDDTKARWAVGRGASDELLERARVSADAGSARFVRPNQPGTTEYIRSRLNLGLDAQDVVWWVLCG
jgi:hypothetical protein